MGDRTGSNNNNWRGGRVVDPRGYVLIRVGVGHPLADVRGYAYEHRLVAQEKTAKKLTGKDMVRHDNRRPGDNADGNLTVTNRLGLGLVRRKPHGKTKRLPGEGNPIVKCACGCGGKFKKFDTSRRLRIFLPSHNSRYRQ